MTKEQITLVGIGATFLIGVFNFIYSMTNNKKTRFINTVTSSRVKWIGELLLYRAKERVLKKAGLHHIRLHDLRHGVGSILLDNGVSITGVAEQLGDVPKTIAGTYSHSLRRGSGIASIIDE